jgi:hypothetical protein
MRPLARGFLDRPAPTRLRAANYDFSDPDVTQLLSSLREHELSVYSGFAGWSNWERTFVRWAEREGFDMDYATSEDLDSDEHLLDDYQLYVSVGHDEYWSAGMRDSVERFVENGGNAVFFSGNTCCWQIRFAADLSSHLCYKTQFELDPVFGVDNARLSTLWSDHLVKRPENELTGVSMMRGGYVRFGHAVLNGPRGYCVWRPDHWLLDGAGVGYGDLLGASTGVVGYECDGCDMTLADGVPIPTGSDGTPPTFEIVATSPAHLWEAGEHADGFGDPEFSEVAWMAERVTGSRDPTTRTRFGRGHAVLGTFRAAGARGGTVVTVGSTDWVFGLPQVDDGIAQVTRNILTRLSEPARDDEGQGYSQASDTSRGRAVPGPAAGQPDQASSP